MASWSDDSLKLRDFARAANESGIVEDTSEVYEKPYKFDDEFEVWKNAGYPLPEDANWDDFTSQLEVEGE